MGFLSGLCDINSHYYDHYIEQKVQSKLLSLLVVNYIQMFADYKERPLAANNELKTLTRNKTRCTIVGGQNKRFVLCY